MYGLYISNTQIQYDTNSGLDLCLIGYGPGGSYGYRFRNHHCAIATGPIIQCCNYELCEDIICSNTVYDIRDDWGGISLFGPIVDIIIPIGLNGATKRKTNHVK